MEYKAKYPHSLRKKHLVDLTEDHITQLSGMSNIRKLLKTEMFISKRKYGEYLQDVNMYRKYFKENTHAELRSKILFNILRPSWTTSEISGFKEFLFINRNSLNVNVDLMTKTLNIYDYGNLHVGFIYNLLSPADIDKYEEYRKNSIYLKEADYSSFKLPENWISDVKAYMINTLKGVDSVLPTFRGFKLTVNYDSGYPYVTIKNKNGYSVRTPQYGLNFNSIEECSLFINSYPFHLTEKYADVVSKCLDVKNPTYISDINKDLNLKILLRAMGFLISKINRKEARKLVITSLNSDPYNLLYTSLLSEIKNLYVLSDRLCHLVNLGKTGEFMEPEKFIEYLGILYKINGLQYNAVYAEGWLIIEYLKRNPEAWNKCKFGYIKNLPFYIQDYLYDGFDLSDIYNFKYGNRKSYKEIVSSELFPNEKYDGVWISYLLNRDLMSEGIFGNGKISWDDLSKHTRDILIDLDIEDDIRKLSIPCDSKFMDTYRFYSWYWVKGMNLELNSVNSVVYDYYLYVVLYFILSGGLENNMNNSVIKRPKNSLLILFGGMESEAEDDEGNYVFDAFMDSIAGTILCMYGLDKDLATYLEFDEKLNILERGYIHPLPLKDEIFKRIKKWDSYNEKQRNLLLLYTKATDYRERYLMEKKDVIKNKNKRPFYEKFLEEVFSFDDDKTSRKALLKYGFIPPNDVSAYDYIHGEIVHMVYILDPDTNSIPGIPNFDAEFYTDLQIFNIIGGMIAYQSREELITKAEDIFNDGFEKPIFSFPSFCNRRIFENGTFLKDIGSTDDRDESPLPTDSLYICYGATALSIDLLAWGFKPTGSKYGVRGDDVLSSTEIHASASIGSDRSSLLSASHFAGHNDENLESEARAYSIYDWENSTRDEMVGKELSREEVNDLLSIVKYIKYHYEGDNYKEEDVAEVDNLIDEIEKCIEYISIVKGEDEELSSEFQSMTEDDQKLVVKALTQLFYIGMYFRQWNGEGDFPLEASKTGTEYGFNADESTAKARLEFEDILESMSESGRKFIYSLPVVESVDGKLAKNLYFNFRSYWDGITGKASMEQNKEKLEDLARYTEASKVKNQEVMNEILSKYGGRMPVVVVEGTYCIRMASTVLVGTGFYYGKLFGGFKNGEQKNYRIGNMDAIE